ncbi:MAG: hypothetical protein ACM31C_27195 [Acidobacteriota bacterium]
MITARELRTIATSLARNDYLRRTRGQREWLHFCVAAPGVDLAVNLSLVHDARTASERVRLTMLARAGGRWEGDVDDLAPEQLHLRGGDVFAAWPGGRIELRDGRFAIVARLARRPLAVALTIAPRTLPSLATNARIGAGTIGWLVVPRAIAAGTIEVAGDVRSVTAAPAYHDHNWGRFEHRDVAWQWGHAQDGDASAVLARLTDPGETTTYSQVLMLWHGLHPSRVFRGDELSLEREGLLRAPRVFVVPRVATAIARAASDVPRRLHLRARGDGDEVHGVFEAEDVARIVVPDDHGLGATAIHEVVGTLALTGHVRGAPVALTGRGMFELVGRLA